MICFHYFSFYQGRLCEDTILPNVALFPLGFFGVLGASILYRTTALLTLTVLNKRGVFEFTETLGFGDQRNLSGVYLSLVAPFGSVPICNFRQEVIGIAMHCIGFCI